MGGWGRCLAGMWNGEAALRPRGLGSREFSEEIWIEAVIAHGAGKYRGKGRFFLISSLNLLLALK